MQRGSVMGPNCDNGCTSGDRKKGPIGKAQEKEREWLDIANCYKGDVFVLYNLSVFSVVFIE